MAYVHVPCSTRHASQTNDLPIISNQRVAQNIISSHRSLLAKQKSVLNSIVFILYFKLKTFSKVIWAGTKECVKAKQMSSVTCGPKIRRAATTTATIATKRILSVLRS